MKTLKEMSDLHFDIVVLPNGAEYYRLIEPIQYISSRFKKTATVQAGYLSDGASGPAIDIVSKGWWVHDWLCEHENQDYPGAGRWDDGSQCTAWESSWVLHDILMKENRWFRARSWFVATFCYQWLKETFRSPPKHRPPRGLDHIGIPIALT